MQIFIEWFFLLFFPGSLVFWGSNLPFAFHSNFHYILYIAVFVAVTYAPWNWHGLLEAIQSAKSHLPKAKQFSKGLFWPNGYGTVCMLLLLVDLRLLIDIRDEIMADSVRRLVLWKLPSSKLQRSLLLLLGVCLVGRGCAKDWRSRKVLLEKNWQKFICERFQWDYCYVICEFDSVNREWWLPSESRDLNCGKKWRCQGWRCKPPSPVTHPATVKAWQCLAYIFDLLGCSSKAKASFCVLVFERLTVYTHNISFHHEILDSLPSCMFHQRNHGWGVCLKLFDLYCQV